MHLPILVFALFLATSKASADDSFRCGTKLVVEGETKAQVQSKCGDPDDTETRTILRRPIVWVHGRPLYVGDGMLEVPVETWTYNLGPYKFMRLVRFIDGRVDEIETLGYGY